MKDYIAHFLDMWKDDYRVKTLSSSALSALIGLGFIIFNGILGVTYRSVFHISVCIYYILLAAVRGINVNALRKTISPQNAGMTSGYKRICLITHIMMIFTDFALIAPIAYMVQGRRSYEFGMIPAIIIAAYTMYRLAKGIINFNRARKEENVFIKELRTINLQDALVAILSLQNTLIVANGSDMRSMIQLTGWTSGGIWLLILGFTIKSYIDIRMLLQTEGK